MSQNKQQLTNIVTILAAVAVSVWAWWWTSSNVLPDGYQNEYLHVGNAFDLWDALLDGDLWHLRYYMYTVLAIWLLHSALADGGSIWNAQLDSCAQQSHYRLWFLVWCVLQLSKDESSAAIPLLVLFTPAVYGTLVRFEPNLANIAWVAAGVLCLVNSQHFQNRNWIRLWAVCLGLGLMTDRLSVAFFWFQLPCRAFGLAVILLVFVVTC